MVEQIGRMLAAEISRKRVERMRSQPHWRWHLDEVFVKINGITHDLWRAVDQRARFWRLTSRKSETAKPH